MSIVTVPESLESLAASFTRVLYIEGKADRTLVLYWQSVATSADWLATQGQHADLDA